MRFMVIVKADERSEAGVLPSQHELAAMGRFNEEMVKAGIMLAGDGLQATSKGARIAFGEGAPKVIDGPFAEAKELIAGYWIIQVKSKEEAVAWMTRAPFERGTIELRQLFELSDFPQGPGLDKHIELSAQMGR